MTRNLVIFALGVALFACTTLDNGCHLRCGECTDLDLKCDIHGKKTEGPGIPLP